MLKVVDAPQLVITETASAEMRRRPETLRGQTIQVESPHGTVYTTINEDENGLPVEIFVTVGKAGSDVTADAEGLGRALSVILRMPSKMGAIQRLQVMHKHLSGIGGSRDFGFGSRRVRSIPDAIAHAIRKYLVQRGVIEEGV